MSSPRAEPNRLIVFLRFASERNWCHRSGCTTCGSHEFFGGLQDLVDEMGGGLVGRMEMVKSLASLPLTSIEPLVEDVLIWLACDISADDLRCALGRSDAGVLFASMKAAHAAAQARRHAHDLRNDPSFVEAERARKQAERKAAHQMRLAAKTVRDAARKGNK